MAISTLLWTIILLLLSNIAWSCCFAWLNPPRIINDIEHVAYLQSGIDTYQWCARRCSVWSYHEFIRVGSWESASSDVMREAAPKWLTAERIRTRQSNGGCLMNCRSIGWPVRLLWIGENHLGSRAELIPRTGIRLRWNQRFCDFPLRPIWTGQLICAAFWFILIGAAHFGRDTCRRYRHRCPICGYNLHLNTTGVCPECGSIMEPEKRPSHVRRASNRHVVISTFLLTLGLLVLTDMAWAFAFEPRSTRLGRFDAIVQSRICGASVCSDNPECSNLAFAARSRDVSVFFLRTITTPDKAGVKAWPLIDGSVPGGYNALVPRSLRAAYGAHESAENRRKDYGMLAWTVGWPFRMLWCSEYYTQFDRKPRDLTYAMLSADLADHLPAWLAKRDQYMPYRPILAGHLATGSIYFLLIWFFRYGYRVTLRLIRRYCHRCPTCGYNLHLNTTGVCPECGTRTDAGAVV